MKNIQKMLNIYIFVRHGETHYNKKKIAQGTDDTENSQLNEQGKKDAEQTAKNIEILVNKAIESNMKIVIITSPLKRAKETGEIIRERLKISSEVYNFLDKDEKVGFFEINMGDKNAVLDNSALIALLNEQGKEQKGAEDGYQQFMTGNDYNPNAGFKDFNGENREDVRKRNQEGIKYLNSQYENTLIILVSHRYTLAELVRQFDYKITKELGNGEFLIGYSKDDKINFPFLKRSNELIHQKKIEEENNEKKVCKLLKVNSLSELLDITKVTQISKTIVK